MYQPPCLAAQRIPGDEYRSQRAHRARSRVPSARLAPHDPSTNARTTPQPVLVAGIEASRDARRAGP